MAKKLILASGSPRRRELLEKAGFVFDVVASDYEEDMSLPLPPPELVIHLSRGKAERVAWKFRDAVVLAADTIVVLDGAILGKPHTREKAREMLRLLSGKPHSVFTGFTIIFVEAGKSLSRSVETKVHFKDLTTREIDEYISTGEPLDKAGAYAIQGRAGVFVEKLEGSFSNVVGLPVEEVLLMLKEIS